MPTLCRTTRPRSPCHHTCTCSLAPSPQHTRRSGTAVPQDPPCTPWQSCTSRPRTPPYRRTRTALVAPARSGSRHLPPGTYLPQPTAHTGYPDTRHRPSHPGPTDTRHPPSPCTQNHQRTPAHSRRPYHDNAQRCSSQHRHSRTPDRSDPPCMPTLCRTSRPRSPSPGSRTRTLLASHPGTCSHRRPPRT